MRRRDFLKAAGLTSAGLAVSSCSPEPQHDIYSGREVFFVNAHDGVDPTGSRDCTAGLQGVLDAVPNGGGLVIFRGHYRVDGSLEPKDGTELRGLGYPVPFGITPNPARLAGQYGTGPVLRRAGSSNNVVIRGLEIDGNPASPTSVGIHATAPARWVIEAVHMRSFGGPAIQIAGGAACTFQHLYLQGMLHRAGWATPTAVLDLGGTDHHLSYVECGASIERSHGRGNICGLVLRNGNCFVDSCIVEFNQIGIVCTYLYDSLNHFAKTRSEFNNCQGWQIDGSGNEFIGCISYLNGLADDDTFDGFVVSGRDNIFVACRDTWEGAYVKTRYCFSDSANAGVNQYIACRSSGGGKTGLTNFSGAGTKVWLAGKEEGLVSTVPIVGPSGVTGSRPSAGAAGVGAQWYDTTLLKPIWSDGTNWRDATGAAI